MRWLRWSKARRTSESISARSGRPRTSGLGSPSGSTVRTRSYPKKPTAPPANGGRSGSGAWRCRSTASAASAYGSPGWPSDQRTTSRGRQPMNDQRPTRWPCSADSSRKAGWVGSSARSLRNALTGVSVSAMNVWRSGISACSRASTRTVSRSGAIGNASTPTANEHLLRVGERPPAAVEQDGQMEEDVGGLVVDAIVGLDVGGLDDLLGLLLDLRARELAVIEQPDHVGAVGALGATALDDALDRGQGLVGRHAVDLAAMEARALAGVAGGAGGLDEGEQRVAVAVQAQRADRLRVARGRALVPLLGARAAVEVQLARLQSAAQGLGVHVRKREDLAGAPVLDDARDQALLVEGDVGGVEHGADPSLGRMAARVAAALAVLALGFAMGAIGLPSSYLFAALVVGVGVALVRPGAVSVPGWGFTAGQAVTGVVLGAYLRSSTLSAVASDWLPVTLVSLGTLAVTTLCGIVLARLAPVDRPTASLGMIAGGASGIVAMADELGADGRLVAFMQYLRVLLIVAYTPLAAGLVFGAHGGSVPGETILGTPGD